MRQFYHTEFHACPDPRPGHRDYVLTEEQAIRRLAQAMANDRNASHNTVQWTADNFMWGATVCWNEAKAIALEEQATHQRKEAARDKLFPLKPRRVIPSSGPHVICHTS